MEDRNVLNKDTSYGRKRRKRSMVSIYIIFEHFLRTFKKRARDMRNSYNNKLIDIYHDQDVLVIHSIWWTACKCIVFGRNNKLRGLRAQSIEHTIERLEEQMQDDLYYVGKLIYTGNEHNWLVHDMPELGLYLILQIVNWQALWIM